MLELLNRNTWDGVYINPFDQIKALAYRIEYVYSLFWNTLGKNLYIYIEFTIV